MLYKFDSKFKFNFETLKIECSCKKNWFENEYCREQCGPWASYLSFLLIWKIHSTIWYKSSNEVWWQFSKGSMIYAHILFFLFFRGTCWNGVCVGFCKVRGQLPCVCSDESGNSCRRCCKVSEGAQCSPYPNEGPLPDGQICVSGFCKQVTL